MNLVSESEWSKLTPFEQGYVLYKQAGLPGSELKSLLNPYRLGSPEWISFEEGELEALRERYADAEE